MDPYWQISLEEEYSRDKNLKKSDVSVIQEWMLEQPHLPKLSDHQVALFLSACKYSIEYTKNTIDLNYTMRTKMPEIFSNRNISSKWGEITTNHSNFGIMPKDSQGNAVIVIKIKPMDISNWNLDEYAKLMFMVQDISNVKYGAVSGYIFVKDLGELTFSQLLRMSASKMANIMKFLQEASICRINSIHLVNTGVVVEKLFLFISPFLREEVKKAITIHRNYESLNAVVEQSSLPSDYGGTNSTLEKCHEETVNALKTFQPWFDEETKQRVDETKRKNDKSKNSGLKRFFKSNEID